MPIFTKKKAANVRRLDSRAAGCHAAKPHTTRPAPSGLTHHRTLLSIIVGYEPTTIYKYRFKIILMVYYVPVVPYGAKHYAE
jgi:hypothetical protein